MTAPEIAAVIIALVILTVLWIVADMVGNWSEDEKKLERREE